MWHEDPPFAAWRWHHHASRLAILSVTLSFLSFAAPLAAQDSPCDPAVERNAKGGSLGYRSRGDHCEGLYATDVAATMMWVASLTVAFAEYDLSSTAPLHVSWSAPQGKLTHLRAHGIKRDLYYRMDLPRATGTDSWQWPTDVLAAQGIERSDIGVLGWVDESVGAVEYELFVPVSVTLPGTMQASSGAGSYEMIVVPNVRLEEVYVSLAKVDTVGDRPEGEYIKKQEALGQRVYPTQRPIKIQLSEFTEPGIYLVEVTATRSDGRPVTMDPMWVYHPGW
jgi:hypothetical protein